MTIVLNAINFSRIIISIPNTAVKTKANVAIEFTVSCKLYLSIIHAASTIVPIANAIDNITAATDLNACANALYFSAFA